jgi:hypothetical protein
LVVVLFFGAVLGLGALVFGFGRLVPAPAPEPSQTPAASPVASVTPAPTPTEAPIPSSTPRPPAVAPEVLRVAFGDPAPVVERGRQVGTVSVRSAVYRERNEGVEAAAGRRWLRVALTFRATADLTFDGGRWSALDTTGRRYRWTKARAPEPALGAGTLEPGQRRTGYLVFSVPSNVTIGSLVLQDADANDIAVLTIP